MSNFWYKEPVTSGQTPTLQSINTGNLCLICLKEIDINCTKEAKAFCRVLCRYFGVDLLVPELRSEYDRKQVVLPTNNFVASDNLHFKICDDCATLAEQTSQLFQQLETVQMKLNHCGQYLCDIIKDAGRVPSRVARFHKTLSLFDDTPTETSIAIAESTRRTILRKCSQWNKSKSSNVKLPTMTVSLAKNSLRKIRTLNIHSIAEFPPLLSTCPSQYSDQENGNSSLHKEEEEEFVGYMGYLISLWIVILLALLDVDQLIEMINFGRNRKLTELPISAPSIQQSVDPESELEQQQEFPEKIFVSERKRKASEDGDNSNHVHSKKSLLEDLTLDGKPITLQNLQILAGSSNSSVTNPDDSADKMSENVIIREEFTRFAERLPKGAKNKRRREPCNEEKLPFVELQMSPLIAKEQTLNAGSVLDISVEAIKAPNSGNNVSMKEEFQVQLHVSGTKKDSFQTETDGVDGTNPPMKVGYSVDSWVKDSMKVTGIPPVDRALMELPDSDSASLILNAKHSPTPRNKKSTYRCHICCESFHSRAKIEKHRAVDHHLTNYVKCPTCSKMFPSYFQLEAHRAVASQCKIDDNTKQLEMLDIARPFFPFDRNVTGRVFCSFDDCYEVFNSSELLHLHLKAHGTYHCLFGCTQVFRKAHELAAHEITSHPSGHFAPSFNKCPRCEFTTSQEEEYISHFVYTHLNISPVVKECQVCPKGFLTNASSRAHFQMFHHSLGKEERIFTCDV